MEGDSTDLLLASASEVPECIENAIKYADSITCRPAEWFHTKASRFETG